MRETRRMRLPVEAARVHQHAAHGAAMAAHELGEGMHDDVGAELRRLEQHRGRHGVVHDQRHAMVMRHAGDCLNIADIPGGIAHRLAEHRAGVFVDTGGQRLGTVAGGKTPFDALTGQQIVQQGYGWCRKAAGWRGRCSSQPAPHWRRHNKAPPGRWRWRARRPRLPAPSPALPAPPRSDWRCGCSDNLPLHRLNSAAP